MGKVIPISKALRRTVIVADGNAGQKNNLYWRTMEGQGGQGNSFSYNNE